MLAAQVERRVVTSSVHLANVRNTAMQMSLAMMMPMAMHNAVARR